MKAAFYKAKGTIVDRLIKWWTKGNYYGDGYHVFGYYSKDIGRSYRAIGFLENISMIILGFWYGTSHGSMVKNNMFGSK